MRPIVSVLISTYGKRIDQVSSLISNIKLDPRVEILIGHQGGVGDIVFDSKNVRYFCLDGFGVTKSRNFLLKECSGEIAYFCDDDIKLADDFVDLLIDSHKRFNSAVITFNVANHYGFTRKKYPERSKKRNLFNILSIGTVEISLKVKQIDDIRFPEDQGAGTSIPCGDEAVFLSHVLRDGGRIVHVPAVIAYHDDLSSGGTVSMATIYARGVTIRRVYGLIGAVFIPAFYLRRRSTLFNETNPISAFFCICKGFFKG